MEMVGSEILKVKYHWFVRSLADTSEHKLFLFWLFSFRVCYSYCNVPEALRQQQLSASSWCLSAFWESILFKPLSDQEICHGSPENLHSFASESSVSCNKSIHLFDLILYTANLPLLDLLLKSVSPFFFELILTLLIHLTLLTSIFSHLLSMFAALFHSRNTNSILALCFLQG